MMNEGIGTIDKPKSRGGIHYAKLENSPRLQRVMKVLSDGREHSTRDIQRQADVCAVGTCMDELQYKVKS